MNLQGGLRPSRPGGVTRSAPASITLQTKRPPAGGRRGSRSHGARRHRACACAAGAIPILDFLLSHFCAFAKNDPVKTLVGARVKAWMPACAGMTGRRRALSDVN